jgi:hypothetical protein
MAATPAPTPVAEKPAETKAQKFARLANLRVNKALDAIANIGGLASKTNYEYTPAQAAAMFGALEAEMSKLQTKFKNPDAVASVGFDISAAVETPAA